MDLTEEMEYETMREEVKMLRNDVDRLFHVVEKLTEKTDRLSVIAGGLAEQIVTKNNVIPK